MITGEAEEPPWAAWSDEQLLELPMSKIGLADPGPMVLEQIEGLFAELRDRDLRFRPHVWLSDEWFTPDGIPGFAVPFYLAHPRLEELERSQMLEVEGGTPAWCMRILRHETGHAIDNAYRLRRKRRRQSLFGRSSEPYPEYYSPKPHSKSYVIHLDSWYAQSHPDEDFAETFAVWLDPKAEWAKRFAGWKALRKLEYLDGLMKEIAGAPPLVRTRRRVEPLTALTKTLGEHYAERREKFGVDHPKFYDRDLRRIFATAASLPDAPKASSFVMKVRGELRRVVARWTEAYHYTVDQVLADVIDRCRELDLRVSKSPAETQSELTIFLTVQTMNYLHSGFHRIAL